MFFSRKSIKVSLFVENTQEEKVSKLTKEEIVAKEHLEEMAEITRNLGYNDIQLLNKRAEESKRAIKQKEEIEEQKEIQD